MKEAQNEGDVAPNTISFNHILACYVKSSDPSAAIKAESVLNRMQELYKAGNVDVKPNATSFSYVISALARRGGPESLEKAKALVQTMEDMAASR